MGSVLLAAVGLVYLPGGLLLGAVLGSGLQLDPTWPWLVSLAGNGFAAVLFGSCGALLALLCAVGAGAAVGRAPWAPWALGAAGAALLLTANLPGAVLAFSLVYASALEGRPAPLPEPTPA